MQYTYYDHSHQDQIIQLYRQTFGQSEGQTEGDLIAKLAADFLQEPGLHKDLFIFVAQDKGNVVGSAIFSRLFYPNKESVFVMGPVAIATSCQGQGIGQRLIQYGLRELGQKGVETAITYGDIGFYHKVGFEQIPEDLIQAPLELRYPHGWLAQSLQGNKIQPISGKPKCLDAINHAEFW